MSVYHAAGDSYDMLHADISYYGRRRHILNLDHLRGRGARGVLTDECVYISTVLNYAFSGARTQIDTN